jgi:hypothetical protein
VLPRDETARTACARTPSPQRQNCYRSVSGWIVLVKAIAFAQPKSHGSPIVLQSGFTPSSEASDCESRRERYDDRTLPPHPTTKPSGLSKRFSNVGLIYGCSPNERPSGFAPYPAGFGSTISADLIHSSSRIYRGRFLSTRSVGTTASSLQSSCRRPRHPGPPGASSTSQPQASSFVGR